VGVGRQSGYIPADIDGIGEIGHRLVAFVAGDLGVGRRNQGSISQAYGGLA